MYLKKIETQGFKSFANRAVMEFTPGIMGIVGPNGSGKSNVADAVRWVLGEQSARQLRGSNMQDVIFAGTENRRPMSYAFVSLTIDNSDHSLPVEYDEVSVSRQVFRSGESEYRLNGNLCRLKDIYEIFYDSGIGKEGYSIIGQGQIEMVLSNKPEERRLMFDEAAGIVKYKKRRDITLKKLESEQASRERIEDILGELEKQVGPLEKQSAKAKTYLKLRDELKEYEVGAFALEADELEEKLNNARINLETVSADLEKANREAESLKDQYDNLGQENEMLEKELARMREQLADLRVANENREGRISLLEEQIKTAQSSRDLMDTRLKDYDEEKEKLSAEREDYYRQKNEIDKEQDRVDDRVSALEESVELLDEEQKDLEFQIEKGNEAIMSSLNRRAEIGGSLAALATREEQLDEQNKKALENSDETRKQLEKLKEESGGLEKQLEELKKDIDSRQARLEAGKEQEQQHRDRLRILEDKRYSLDRELGIIETQKSSLTNLIERYDGYGGSVKAVMEQKGRFSGICGVVADIISSEKKYETAIETVLGSRVQNIVTESEEEAKKIIYFLKENRLGRATFLPLDAVKGDRALARPEALKEEGAIGTASSLVKADKKYDHIVQFLLGAILVVDHLDHALKIARKYDHRLSIVTVEGEYLTPGGVLSGGAFKNNSNLLGRRRELAECETREKDLLKKKKELDAEKAELQRDLSEIERKNRDLDDVLREKRPALAALVVQKESHDDALRRSGNQLEQLEQELKQITSEKERVSDEKGKMSQNVTVLESDSESIRKQITDLAVRLEKLKSEHQDKSRDLEECRMEFASLSQRGDFVLENIRRINELIAKADADKEELIRGGVSVDDLVKERSLEIQTLREEMVQVKDTMHFLEENCQSHEKLREERRDQQQHFFEGREALMQRISDLDKESFRLQNMEQRFEEQMEKQAEYLWTEYEMTPSQAKAIRNPEIKNPAEVRRFINQKKKEIKELGPVYVDAIERYKEVSERYEFLKGQQEDLIKAEKELSDMIKDLEKGMRDQFKEQFALIQEEFSRVFSDLFAGGKGSLILEEGDDVLSSGVIINAQPPGKKLQNMMQLSGGEKALTAIALLFAIQNLKPSPFCLLDEIEAALDEPNVKRFADYLYRLRGTTQFLIITHRRGTMEMADRLYGITMQEKGVSALVSVNLTDPASQAILDEED